MAQVTRHRHIYYLLDSILAGLTHGRNSVFFPALFIPESHTVDSAFLAEDAHVCANRIDPAASSERSYQRFNFWTFPCWCCQFLILVMSLTHGIA